MVRMDVCVEALYDKNGMSKRGKALQMLKVMKGAISVSKSRTGQCIFKNNKLERRNLDRVIRSYKKDCDYIAARYDSQKKVATQRFMKLLDRQTSYHSQDMLEDLLEIKKPEASDGGPRGAGQDSLLKLLDLRLQRPEAGVSGFGLQKIGSKKNEEENEEKSEEVKKKEEKQGEFVTEKKDIRHKYADGLPTVGNKKPLSPAPLERRTTVHGVVLGYTIAAAKQLPPVNARNKGRKTYKEEAEDVKKNVEKLPERDLSDWGEWRLKEKGCFLDYIYRQKTRQEDLIMRNALTRIRSEMSEGNSIKGYRIRQQLQNESSTNTDNTTVKPKGKIKREASIPPIVVQQSSKETAPKKMTQAQTPNTKKEDSGPKEPTQQQLQPESKPKSILKLTVEKVVPTKTMGKAKAVGLHKTVTLQESLPRQTRSLDVVLESPILESDGQGGQSVVMSPAKRADTIL